MAAFLTPEEWRAVAICRLVARYYPQAIDKIREAGGPFTELVEGAIKKAYAELKPGERLTPEKLDKVLEPDLFDFLWRHRGSSEIQQ